MPERADLSRCTCRPVSLSLPLSSGPERARAHGPDARSEIWLVPSIYRLGARVPRDHRRAPHPPREDLPFLLRAVQSRTQRNLDNAAGPKLRGRSFLQITALRVGLCWVEVRAIYNADAPDMFTGSCWNFGCFFIRVEISSTRLNASFWVDVRLVGLECLLFRMLRSTLRHWK